MGGLDSRFSCVAAGMERLSLGGGGVGGGCETIGIAMCLFLFLFFFSFFFFCKLLRLNPGG